MLLENQHRCAHISRHERVPERSKLAVLREAVGKVSRNELGRPSRPANQDDVMVASPGAFQNRFEGLTHMHLLERDLLRSAAIFAVAFSDQVEGCFIHLAFLALVQTLCVEMETPSGAHTWIGLQRRDFAGDGDAHVIGARGTDVAVKEPDHVELDAGMLRHAAPVCQRFPVVRATEEVDRRFVIDIAGRDLRGAADAAVDEDRHRAGCVLEHLLVHEAEPGSCGFELAVESLGFVEGKDDHCGALVGRCCTNVLVHVFEVGNRCHRPYCYLRDFTKPKVTSQNPRLVFRLHYKTLKSWAARNRARNKPC